MGVVLTYKTVGVFNFAYGAIAMFCAFTYWQLHDSWGLTAWVAMPILFLVVAPVLGILLEALYRPLAGLSAEVLIVVSIGVLAALSALVPIVYGKQDRTLQAIFPTSTFALGAHFHVGYDQLGTLLVSLAVAAVLWALLRHTRFGTSTRAAVDNPDLADMVGVHGDNVRRAAWILSTMFAALVGILISPTQGLDVNQLVLVVIYAFAPAVFGRLVSLPLAYIGAPGAGGGGEPALQVFQLRHSGQPRSRPALPGPVRLAHHHGRPPEGGGCLVAATGGGDPQLVGDGWGSPNPAPDRQRAGLAGAAGAQVDHRAHRLRPGAVGSAGGAGPAAHRPQLRGGLRPDRPDLGGAHRLGRADLPGPVRLRRGRGLHRRPPVRIPWPALPGGGAGGHGHRRPPRDPGRAPVVAALGSLSGAGHPGLRPHHGQRGVQPERRERGTDRYHRAPTPDLRVVFSGRAASTSSSWWCSGW